MKKISFWRTITLFLFSASVLTINGQNIYAFAGTGTVGLSGDGSSAVSANLNTPYRTAIDPAGNVIISDLFNHRIRKVNPSGIITTIAGTVPGYNGDGGQATLAEIQAPSGITIDGLGNIYFVDMGNDCVRKINTSGVISTIAGTTTAGFSGDGGAATLSQLNTPFGITCDAIGNIYIADTYNARIRKITPSGIINTIAGTSTIGFGGDGGLAVNASLNLPREVAVDAAGNIYIADTENHRIRKINTSGIISTIAGTGVSGFSGDGAAATLAQLDTPRGVSVDASGNIYIADSYNHRIRKVNSSGIISTIAGNGNIGNMGDGNSANLSELAYPSGVSPDAMGNLFISDAANHKVREICIGNCLANINSFSKNMYNIFLFPNPNNGSFKLHIDSEIKNGEIILINLVGQKVHEQKISQGQNNINTNYLPTGLYSYIILQDKGQISNGKLTIDKN